MSPFGSSEYTLTMLIAIVLLIICNCTTIVGAEELGQPTGQNEVTLVPLALARLKTN